MKELSIEEKAKRYDEAIKVAADIKAGTATYITDGTPVIDAIFPELSESDDEKIRKALISILKSDFEKDTTIYDISVGNIIAWLEKQSEQKFIDTFIEKACEFLNGCVLDYIELKHSNVDTFMDIDNKRFINDFKNYMKEE